MATNSWVKHCAILLILCTFLNSRGVSAGEGATPPTPIRPDHENRQNQIRRFGRAMGYGIQSSQTSLLVQPKEPKSLPLDMIPGLKIY